MRGALVEPGVGDAARLPESGPILTWDAEPKPHRLDAVSKLFGTEVIEPIPTQRGRIIHAALLDRLILDV